jgi:hypothetical protein
MERAWPLHAADPADPRALSRWFEDLVGPPLEPLRDLSGGAWRDLRPWPAGAPPPVWPQSERRKFLLTTAEGRFLLKFAGLGRIGEGKFHRARALHAAGFTPEPLAVCNGFLLERWEPAALELPDADNPGFLARLAAYLACRARTLPGGQGADLATLREMLRRNTELALGPEAASAFARRFADVERLQPRVRRIQVDGRLHRWEWLRTADGRLLKTDALDHCEAHDLVGCQDVAWDLAGAEAEHDFSPEESAALARAVSAQTGRTPDPDLLALLRPAYLAFQLGLWTFAAQATGAASEARRAALYADKLRRLVP